MAQAARLSLRMQKELKLLMTDPPPGVSLPLISENSDHFSSSITSIEARIEGPEGTVYAKGVFNLKIQIPERYPFQPPSVTFVTPIYHPNIDNGGRICLDILNLPPKGAWQPSLNISTVLTSIGLLLSEPNPDDGLMAETSKEYKYNRQVFDQKARSWTEKYAYVGASERTYDSSTSASQSMMEIERPEASSERGNNENEGSRKKLRLIGEKLSLKSRTVARNIINNKENVAPTHYLAKSCLQNHLSISSTTMMSHSAMDCESKPRHEDDKKASNENHKQDLGSSKIIETIVVSDSEDSDEDNRTSRSRVSTMRKLKLGRRI